MTLQRCLAWVGGSDLASCGLLVLGIACSEVLQMNREAKTGRRLPRELDMYPSEETLPTMIQQVSRHGYVIHQGGRCERVN